MHIVKQIDKPLDLSDNVGCEATNIDERRGIRLSLEDKGSQLGTIDLTGGKAYPVTRCLIMSIIVVPIVPIGKTSLLLKENNSYVHVELHQQ